MEVAALVSNAQGKKHKSNVDCFPPVSRLYFQDNTSTASEAPSTRKSTSTLDNLIVSVSAAKTNIKWVLKVVDSNFSLRSCLDLNDLFRVMFPDSTIAINFGVVPYIRNILKETIEISPSLTIPFDESLTGYVQKEQMDIKVRFWCNDKCKVTTSTAKNTVISPNFLVLKFCRKVQFLHSFGRDLVTALRIWMHLLQCG